MEYLCNLLYCIWTTTISNLEIAPVIMVEINMGAKLQISLTVIFESGDITMDEQQDEDTAHVYSCSSRSNDHGVDGFR